MLCKFCKSNTIVIDGVDNPEHEETYRCRVCTKCGKVFYTVEFPVVVNKQFKREWHSHDKKHSDVFDRAYLTPEGVKGLLKRKYKHKHITNNKNK